MCVLNKQKLYWIFFLQKYNNFKWLELFAGRQCARNALHLYRETRHHNTRRVYKHGRDIDTQQTSDRLSELRFGVILLILLIRRYRSTYAEARTK